jgi:hypothetical protein
MGRPHGFRVFLVQPFLNRIKDRNPEEVFDGSAAQAEVLSLLEAVEGTHFFHPRPNGDGEVTRPVRSISVGPVSSIRADLHHLVVSMGEEGSHRNAVSQAGSALDLTGTSPEAEHIITLLFPERSGDSFVVIAHSIRQRDPLELLLRKLVMESLRRKKEAQSAENVAREEARERGDAVPARARLDRLLFTRRQAVDSRYLENIIGSAKRATAEFRALEASDRGARTPPVRRALRISLIDEREIRAGQRAARGWIRSFRQGAPKSASEGVSELAEALHDEDLLYEDEAARYGEAALNVSGEENASTRIAVDTIRDVFTYGVSDVPPSPHTFYTQVEERLPGILADERVNASPIDALEVVRWLDDLT